MINDYIATEHDKVRRIPMGIPNVVVLMPIERVRCVDGFEMSVQASADHYCEPRTNEGPYTHVEVGMPSEPEETLIPYAEDPHRPTETVYCFVPVEVVEAIVLKHGGMQ